MSKIRIGIIGTGLAWERLHYPVIEKLSDKFEIVALANRTVSDAYNFANKIGLSHDNVYEDYTKMLERNDIDAFDILVPIEQNFEVSKKVAMLGKNFICEKPLAPNMEQAYEFLKLSKGSNKILIAENYRYNEENNKIRDIINNGKIGEVVYFVRNNIFSFPKEMVQNSFAAKEWRQHPKFYGGVFLDGAVHDISAIRHIFGAVDCVQAFGKEQKEDFSPFISINANILFKSGVIGNFNYYPSGTETQRPSLGFRIFGTLGNIYLEEKSCGTINIFYNDGKEEQVSYTPEMGYYNEFMNFYNSIMGIEEISVTPHIEFGDTKMIFDILKSINNREIVKVDIDEDEIINKNNLINYSEQSEQYMQ